MKDRMGWRALFEWAGAFAIATLALLGMASIGMLIVPIAMAAAVVAARRNRMWPESFFGGLVGVAAMILIVGLSNLGSTPCPDGPSVSVLMPGQTQIMRCGGSDPTAWLAVGGTLAAAGLAGYAILRGIHRRVTA
jgi:hypothetical protein